MSRRPVLMIDFDGTITKENLFPQIGELNENAIESIKKLQEHGFICCLWTCRNGENLMAAKDFLESKGLQMDYYNESPNDYINGGRKPIADLYIDDASFPNRFMKNPIDWNFITDTLLKMYNL